jgi:phosphopantetheinyl transferase (holo-ACP synthase)
MLLEEKKQKVWERPEWLLKECEYQEKDNRLSREIRGIILRWVLLGNEETPREDAVRAVRGFWVKVKMVMKTSLERIKLLNLLNYQLFERYESIIEAMNVGYDRAAGITHYRDIEEMIKNRNKTIHEILSNGKLPLLQRERSELSAKMFSVKECPSETKIKKSMVFSKKAKETIEPKMIRRPLSHQSNKHRFPSKDFLMSRKVRKMENFIEEYESKLVDVMEGKLEVNIDKKKSVDQNLEMLFDQIMERNMSNHRTISKFTFSHSGKVFKRLSKRTLKPIPKKIIEN